ncbi:hypothetical protein [Neodiprion abietis nucleopolyhedrovirus]|uniref:Uncharacterized protein n=1 Tax=Neodiprion abietis nucleopolyhedrovirus TaxID=204507 RepID=Q0ZP24_9CBAC|nr:hypothetical protein [Neodiprion abietis nucleopolyhedrovirus]ABC74930.1 unknown [Neodiprion abietis nucleopolyhedrovirus]
MYYSRGDQNRQSGYNTIKRSNTATGSNTATNMSKITPTDRHLIRSIDDKLLREETAAGSTTYHKLKDHLNMQVDKKVAQKVTDIENTLFTHLQNICEANNLNCPNIRKTY